MFSFIKYSKPKGENIYDIRFPLSEKDKIINDNNLDFKYNEKVYFLILPFQKKLQKNLIVLILKCHHQ